MEIVSNFVVFLENVKLSGRLFQIFVAFSECPNFKFTKFKAVLENAIVNLKPPKLYVLKSAAALNVAANIMIIIMMEEKRKNIGCL